MKLEKIYQAVLESVSYNIDADGLVSRRNSSGKNMPVTLADEDGERLRLALPTTERLQSGNWVGLTAFHPLSENIVRGESEVITLLRAAMSHRINTVVSMLMQGLIEIAVDKDRHKELSPQQHELTIALSKADDGTASRLSDAIKKLNGKSRTMARLFLKRSGVIDAETYDRAFILSFPLDIKEDRTLFGVQLRVNDVKMIKALMNFVVPDYDTQKYCVGSNSKQAPYLIAALSGFAKIITRLNAVYDMFKDRLAENESSMYTELDWVSELPTLLEHVHDIPPLRGNTGNISSNEVEESDPVPARKITAPNLDYDEIAIAPAPNVKAPTQIQHKAPNGQVINQAVPDAKPSNGTVELNTVLAPKQQPAQQYTRSHTTGNVHAGPVTHYAPTTVQQPPQQQLYDLYGNPVNVSTVPQQQYTHQPAQQQYTHPPQQQGGFAPQQQGGFAPQQQGGFAPQQQGGFAPQQHSFMPQQQQSFMPQQQRQLSPREAHAARRRAEKQQAVNQYVSPGGYSTQTYL